MKKNIYNNYYKDHYKLALHPKDIQNFKKWFLTQWQIIKKNILLTEDTQILEIGSGIGGVYGLLQNKTAIKYTGLDLDKEAVDFCNKYFSTSSFHATSIEEFKTKEKYTYVLAFEILEHLHDPINVLKKINTLMQPNGTFIGTSPYPYKKNLYADKTHLFVLHPENWKRLFFFNGFTDVMVVPMSFFPFLWRIHPSLNIRIPFYIPIPGFISTTLIIAKKK